MFGFKSKQNKELERLLQFSKQDFEFDRLNVRTRLMMAVNSRHLSKADLEKLTFKVKLWPRYAFSAAVAVVLLICTTGFAYASNQAEPGDLLFPVQKLQNQFVLSLPLPASKKEAIRTQIVTTRLQQLSTVQQNPQADPAKIQAIVKESQDSMDDAVNNLPTDASKSIKQARLNALIQQLDDLSMEQEQKIQALKKQTTDTTLQSQIDASVNAINQTREKLHKLHQNDGENQDQSGSVNGSDQTQQNSGQSGDHGGRDSNHRERSDNQKTD